MSASSTTNDLPPAPPAVVSPVTTADAEEAQRLAAQFGLSYSSDPGPETRMRLLIGSGQATLERFSSNQATKPDLRGSLSFTHGRTAHRVGQHGGNKSGKRQPLARAMGLHRRTPNYIVDATAGAGIDAFVLASLGCPVVMLERQGTLCLMLVLAFREAAAHHVTQQSAARLSLIHCDASRWLDDFPSRTKGSVCWPEAPTEIASSISTIFRREPPDVIYMDPMYPHENRKALARKNMQLIQTLAGPDTDSEALLEVSRRVAQRRVVVKRPINAPTVANQKPDTVIRSPKTRYDIYLNP